MSAKDRAAANAKESGASRRKRDLAEATRLAARHGYELVPAGRRWPEMSPEAKAKFDTLGPPPDDEVDLLLWARRVEVTALWLVLTGHLDDGRVKAIKDLVLVAANTHNRAKLEGDFKQLEKAVREKQQSAAIREVPGALAGHSPNDRDAPPRGPRPVPSDPDPPTST